MSLGRLQRAAPSRTVYPLALAFVLVALNIYFTIRSADTMLNNQAMVVHTQDVLDHIQHLRAEMRDAEDGELGYAFTGLEHFLDPYSRALPLINSEVIGLKQLTADNPQQQRYIPDLQKDVARRLDLLAQGI